MSLETASLTLVRPGPAGLEFFWAQRRRDRNFLGGYHAFFAGSIEPGDFDLPIDDDLDDPEFRTAALRECFEECGVLIAGDGLQRFSRRDRALSAALSKDGVLAASRLHHLGWWHTPTWLKPAFVTAFFGLYLTAEEGRRLDDLGEYLDSDEFDSGRWITADEALRAWRNGGVFLTTPIRRVVEYYSRFPSAEKAMNQRPPAPMSPHKHRPDTSYAVEIRRGINVLPLRTPTLPPSTHTNALVTGLRRFAVVDPGPADEAALGPLLDHIADRRASGDQCTAIFLSHHHGDHVGGLPVLSQWLDVPLYGHAATLERVDACGLETRQISDGDSLPIDTPSPLVALHTPGHAPGHLCLWHGETRFLFAADLVASESTILVDPDDQGSMSAYLRSLKRARDLLPQALLPSHGHLVTGPEKLLENYLEHRQMREKKVLEALRSTERATAKQLVSQVYDDAPQAAWPLAQRSLLAHLRHLVERGLATESNGKFIARTDR